MKSSASVLVLGSGNSSTVHIQPGEVADHNLTFDEAFETVFRVDNDPNTQADSRHDLRVVPWPFPSEGFDQVHAYDVLEHLTRQGDGEAFFGIWREIWRVLKPGGLVMVRVPWWDTELAWCDPTHSCIYTPITLSFLNQEAYRDQVGRTNMSDYRGRWWPEPYDFRLVFSNAGQDGSGSWSFALEKPKR